LNLTSVPTPGLAQTLLSSTGCTLQEDLSFILDTRSMVDGDCVDVTAEKQSLTTSVAVLFQVDQKPSCDGSNSEQIPAGLAVGVSLGAATLIAVGIIVLVVLIKRRRIEKEKNRIKQSQQAMSQLNE